jgi:hypothetical protein
MAKTGVVSNAPLDPMGPSARTPNCLRTSAEAERNPASRRPNPRAKKSSVRSDKAADRKAAQAYERELQRREREEAREETAGQKERERRQKAVDKAQKALDEAERQHNRRADALRAEIEAIEKRVKSENAAWGEDEKRLKAGLRRAGE